MQVAVSKIYSRYD